MPSALTYDEYKALASSIDLPRQPFINGKFCGATQKQTFASINPASGEVLAELTQCDQPEVALAVEKSREVFDSGMWSKLHPSERKEILIRLVKLMTRHQNELAVMETLESGKPIHDVANIDIPEALHCLKWHAEAVDKIYDQVAPSGNDAVAMIVREPIGVVGCVLPWNFPILMLAWKIGPALAAGNSVIVKPAEETSMTALRIAELAVEAGIPAGVFNVLTGIGEITGKAMGLHPGIDMISFTGSTEIGKQFLNYSAQSNMKRIVLECGGKNPCIVMDDAQDLDVVAQHVVNAGFWNMGENCSANSRLIVHHSVQQELLKKVSHRMREWRTGHPLNPKNQLGAIVSKAHFDKIQKYIEQGKNEGAELFSGGKPLDNESGYFIEPTVFVNVTPSMTIAKDEIFGPVLSVISIKSEDEAIAIANDTDYGLSASLFTENVRRAHRMARALRVGTVTINTYGEGDISTPFGGFKQSGFGGRDNSVHAHDQYTELKTIWLDLSDQSQNSLG